MHRGIIPIKLKAKDSSDRYKLFRLPASADKGISTAMKQDAEHQYELFLKEGQHIPDFNFTDLNGNVFNKENTAGKILVLKCWFIACGSCVQEFPKLNELVTQYKNRSDILFISLAFDQKQKLKEFLKTHSFLYAVVPDQEEFEMKDLGASLYPTHIVVNKQGIITKMVNSYEDLVPALQKVAAN